MRKNAIIPGRTTLPLLRGFLKSYCSGEVDWIEELEQPVFPYSQDKDGNLRLTLELNSWLKNVTASNLY